MTWPSFDRLADGRRHRTARLTDTREMPNTGNGARMTFDQTSGLVIRCGMSWTSDRLHDPSDRAARATRILDDTAHHADIGKGTVYLHWKTRDELFRAVFEREGLQALEELIQTLLHDPGAWRLHRLARS